jgi:hypothetical protein
MKHLKIEKAKTLENSIQMFSNPSEMLEMEIWELQNEDGTKHPKSDELMVHIRNIAKAKEFIKELFK